VILLDTNVVSEPLKLNADPTVVAWIDAQIIETLGLTVAAHDTQPFEAMGVAVINPWKTA